MTRDLSNAQPLPPLPLLCATCLDHKTATVAVTIVKGNALCMTHARPEPAPPKPKRQRQPDPAFDALADLHGGTANLTPAMAKTVGTALAVIRKTSPTVTRGDIDVRAGAYRRLPWNSTGRPATAMALAKWWGDCAPANQPPDRYAGSRTIDSMTAEEIEGVTHGG